MGAPYDSVSISNYNSNPPSDDGAQTPTNRITWATIKTKLSDTLKTALESVNTNIGTAFGKIIGGAGVTSTTNPYTIQTADQGKLIRLTSSGTVTTPDATSVGSPFVVALLNNSSGNVVVDGSGSQTVDGNATVTLGPGQGCFLFTDGTNWFTTGLLGVLGGNQMSSGQIINGTIAESNGSNAVTFAVKNLAGNDPSATDPVIIAFRNSTAATGNYVYRSITAACSITIPATALMGAANGIPFRVWLGLLDNAGTVELFAINCLSGVAIYPFGQFHIISTTALSTGSDNAHVAYSTTSRSSKPYVPLGYASYESGLSTAGNWNVSPTRLELFGPGVPLPGTVIQTQVVPTGNVATGTTVIPIDDTIPQNTEGDQFMSQAITQTSTANLLDISSLWFIAHNSSTTITVALFQDSTANASAAMEEGSAGGEAHTIPLNLRILAGTTSPTTIKGRAGGGTGTLTFNGSAGARRLGGSLYSYIRVDELMT